MSGAVCVRVALMLADGEELVRDYYADNYDELEWADDPPAWLGEPAETPSDTFPIFTACVLAGHEDDARRLLGLGGELVRFSRDELVTLAMALEEFRGPGERALAGRVNEVLRGPGDRFTLAPDAGLSTPASTLRAAREEGR